MAGSEELMEKIRNLSKAIEELDRKREKVYAQTVAWLREEHRQNEVLRQMRSLEEAVEEEEIYQLQRKKEAEAPGSMLPEVVEAQLERALLARRRSFLGWLGTFCLLLVGLELAIGFTLAATVLYASRYDPVFFYRLLLRALPEETYLRLAYVLGKVLPAVTEGLLPF